MEQLGSKSGKYNDISQYILMIPFIITGSSFFHFLLVSIFLAFLFWCKSQLSIIIRQWDSTRNHSDSRTHSQIYQYSIQAYDNTQAIISSYSSHQEISDVNWDPNDKHNVHNVTISEGIREKLEEMADEISQMPKNVEEIVRYYRKSDKYKSRRKIFHVLNYLKIAEALYSPKKIQEIQILNWIFQQAKKCGEDAMEELAYQIDNCYDPEEGSICCLEGRIVRYFQALHLAGKVEFQVVPLWYYKNEIENHCARVLDAEIREMTSSQQQRYFNPVEKLEKWEKKWIEDINDKIVQKLDTYFKKEYFDKLGQERFEEITKPCYQAIIF